MPLGDNEGIADDSAFHRKVADALSMATANYLRTMDPARGTGGTPMTKVGDPVNYRNVVSLLRVGLNQKSSAVRQIARVLVSAGIIPSTSTDADITAMISGIYPQLIAIFDPDVSA